MNNDNSAAGEASYLATWMDVFRPRMSVEYQITQQTGEHYRKKLAVAHHLKEAGHPMAFNRLHPDEQKAAEKLAKRYPIPPEAKQAMKDGRIKGPEDPENPPLSPDEQRQMQVALDEDREHYPRSLGPKSAAAPATAP